MRLSKYLAGAGVASRRKAEQLIREGRVRVDGVTASRPQEEVSETSEIQLDGVRVGAAEKKVYLLLDKPSGFLSTVTDTHGRPTVLDLVKDVPARVYPVGRLDADTSGVLLLTNDGELAYRLTHPRFQIPKVYRAWVKGRPEAPVLEQMSRGMRLAGRKTAPASVRLLKAGAGGRSLLEITLTEGRKRQVKEMCRAAGYPVLRLRRIRFAFLTARGLRAGEYRALHNAEVKRLYRMTGKNPPAGP